MSTCCSGSVLNTSDAFFVLIRRERRRRWDSLRSIGTKGPLLLTFPLNQPWGVYLVVCGSEGWPVVNEITCWDRWSWNNLLLFWELGVRRQHKSYEICLKSDPLWDRRYSLIQVQEATWREWVEAKADHWAFYLRAHSQFDELYFQAIIGGLLPLLRALLSIWIGSQWNWSEKRGELNVMVMNRVIPPPLCKAYSDSLLEPLLPIQSL